MDTRAKLALDHILDLSAEQKASDVHLSVGSSPIVRIDGKLLTLKEEPVITKEFMEGFVNSVLDIDQKKTLEQQKEIVLAFQFKKQARFRVNIFYQKRVLAAYLRLIGDHIIPLEQLGLPMTLNLLAQHKKGLLIISGAFGSGKTTTTASIIDFINRQRAAYIQTVERPIEYSYGNQKSIIEQREVGRDTPSFEQALRSVTQEDIDVLFLSEAPSLVVVKQVMKIAASGRLVILNIEADTVIKSLEALINRYPSNEQPIIREQIALNLAGIVCQRLVPKIGGGLAPIAEIMTATPPIQSLIKEGSLNQLSNIILTSREEGMVSLDASLADLVKTNQVHMNDAINAATDPQQLQYMLHT